ncbi:autotransporter outer membrane beta-barrel domain-containing protein [Acidaminococcus timonensis]|uniref:autotransporter outer membrane beta-barrel domain-containing protein n=1 Tax=Acidaminococcus timonensis TaxID=1871002 RepID=UPI0025FBACFA|nr:autotransporter outer membrane beta-barrel domain-containing protein [Acidaminococcus timonensis]
MKTIYSKHKTLGRSLTAAILLSLALPVLPGEAAETISRWTRTSATEGDSIAVDINGWGGEAADPVNLTVGKDTTQKVTIGEYNAGPYSTTTVKGKEIGFTGYTGVGSGSITIGDATATDSIHFAKNLNAYRSGWDDSLSGGTIIARSAGDITVDGNINATNTPTLDLAGKDLTVAGRTFFQDGSSSLKGTDTVTLGTAGGDQNALQVIYTYGNKNQSLYVGGEKAVTTLNGGAFLDSDGPLGNKVTLDGSRITLNATVKPDASDYDWAGRSNSLYVKDVDVTVGNKNTESTTLNGNLTLSGGSATLHGTDAVTLNGAKGDKQAVIRMAGSGHDTVHVGQADTKQTSITGGIAMAYDTTLTVSGKNVLLDNRDNRLLVAAGTKTLQIGNDPAAGDATENTIIKGGIVLSASPLAIHGKNITWSEVMAPELNIEPGNTGTHDALVIQHQDDTPATIGDSDSTVSVDGRLISLSGDIVVDGKDIHLYEGTNKNQYLVATTGYNVDLGSDTTETLAIDGGVLAMGGSSDGTMTLKGQTITLDAGSGHNALQANNMPLDVGDASTKQVAVNGEIFSAGEHAPITVEGSTVTLSGNGKEDALVYTTGGSVNVSADTLLVDGTQATYAARTNGGSITLGKDGTHGLINGNLQNGLGGTLVVNLTGADSAINGNIHDLNVEQGGDGTTTLNLTDGAQWNFDKDSSVTTLEAKNGTIAFDPSSTDQKLLTRNMDGIGATVQINSTGTSHDNDRLYIRGSHTGRTELQLNPVSGSWSDGALGSILVSVGDEQGSFYVPQQEKTLFFHHVDLGTYQRSNGDTVTDGYNTDWYLKDFRKTETDDHGNHTHFVQNLVGARGVNYQIWRDGFDTLFKRLGDLHSQSADHPEGVWARVKGTRDERRGGEFGFGTQSHTYQVGYDKLLGQNAKERHYQGIGLEYNRGHGFWQGGTSDVNGFGVGLYDTHVKPDGQYWDFVVKGQHLSDDVYGGYGARTTLDNNGFSAGAEYGYKRQNRQGWFVEPQAQFTLGWLKGAGATLANGVQYEENDIHSAVGRAGLRAGFEGPRAQLFAKADWFHEFGGNGQVRLSNDEGLLRLRQDYSDNWFEYGFGLAVQLAPNSQFYLDAEKSNTGAYHKNWSWDAGVRWTF